MTVLIGHPAGNPNSFQAALAHFEAGWLEAFCLPWMPSRAVLGALERVPPLREAGQRLGRRHFAALVHAPKVQGRIGEMRRLLTRALGGGDERLSYAANDWLMHTMMRECRRARVTAVHAYEDCSALQFAEARRLGKACIYDMPIGYYPAWEATQAEYARQYASWLPAGGLPSASHVRPEQKRKEMELADLVLAPSSFVKKTIRNFHPEKRVALAPYGVDLDFWHRPPDVPSDRPLRFISAGQLSIRKNTPGLIEAWRAAGLRDAELELVGDWQLADRPRSLLAPGLFWRPPCSHRELRERFWNADVLVFPSLFEGFGLVVLEAMACGLSVIASDATAGPDVVTGACGRIVPAGDVEALVEALRWFAANRDRLPTMCRAARARAEEFTWARYREAVVTACAAYV